ncbi:MAG: helix-turn-helix transcriptional regulator [Clostridia bacterium]|nr:helix-turn-helix transcriptional regulator [Clostridia bacterium]
MENNILTRLNVKPGKCAFVDELAQFKITHDYFTDWAVFIPMSGEILYSIEQSGEHRVKTGELFLCPPYCNIDKTAPAPLSFWFMTFVSDAADRPAALGNPVLPVNDRVAADLALMAGCMPRDPYRIVLQMDIWYQIRGLYRDPMIPAQPPDRRGSMAGVLAYIDANLNQKLTLAELAARSGYSQSALSQCFRLHTGRTPMGYITDRRMNLAKKLIADTRMTLREVAASCGYANEFYLSSVFHKHTGMSPSEYRRRNI